MIPNWYNQRKDFINNEIKFFINSQVKNHENISISSFKEALIYATDGGKKLRAILALEFYISITGTSFEEIENNIKDHKTIINFAVALELVHAYSLVHDDLPCMDNDTIRRGKPTVWKKYGEYMATLVGDNLQTLAFEALSSVYEAKKGLQLTNLLAKSIGSEGMIGGQILDIYFENNPDKTDLPSLMQLHNKKTGALIKASIQGAVIASGKLNFLHKLTPFGEKLGLAFQIKDDILDVEGNEKEVGKSIGGEKKGFVYILGIKKSKDTLKELITDCKVIVKTLHSPHIHFLVDYVESRKL